MDAVVVYESLWGNTAAIARAVATGIGGDAQVGTTDQIPPALASEADLVVAGAPVHSMSIPTRRTVLSAASKPRDAIVEPPEIHHRLLRDWLDEMPLTSARGAAFDTRYPGMLGYGGATYILRTLAAKGCFTSGGERGFVVMRGSADGSGSLLREGELDEAHAWGEFLGRTTRH